MQPQKEGTRRTTKKTAGEPDDIRGYEQDWEIEMWEKDQDLLDKMQEEREARDAETAEYAQGLLDQRIAYLEELKEIELEYLNTTYDEKREAVDKWEKDQIELIRQRGKELGLTIEEMQDGYTRIQQRASEKRADIAAAEAQAVSDTVSSLTDSILTIMNAFVEDERAIAYTRAILGSAQALSSLIALAVEESSSWYEAVAKGIASAAEVIALWAPIFSDINSAPTGAHMVTNGPMQLSNGMYVGDNPGGREEVSVTPVSSPNIAGGGGGATYQFNFSGVNEDQFMRMMHRLERSGKIGSITRVEAM